MTVAGKKTKNRCLVCQSNRTTVFFAADNMPVLCNVLSEERDQALRIPRGAIALGFCQDCGHISNAAFDQSLIEYDHTYENSLHFSKRFDSYARQLAGSLIEKYNLSGKTIIEIGCGQGDFLKLLCQPDGNRGIGFDPGYRRESAVSSSDAVDLTFIDDIYSLRYADYLADFICCRHVLEHIAEPRAFLFSIRNVVLDRPGAVLFFEVPNAPFILKDMAIWDIIYEHCSYFSECSLAYLFESAGFRICDLYESYDGQFLCIEAMLSDDLMATDADHALHRQNLADDVMLFKRRYEAKKREWQTFISEVAHTAQRTVLWGAGSKAISFLNTLQIGDQIDFVVDINPRKVNRYIAGTGHQIVAPAFLKEYQPDNIVIMNPIYLQEIRQQTSELTPASRLLVA